MVHHCRLLSIADRKRLADCTAITHAADVSLVTPRLQSLDCDGEAHTFVQVLKRQNSVADGAIARLNDFRLI
jgi:hypothetical protein